MAKTRKIRAAKGAKAIVLTKMINPKQRIPNGDKDHRSEVVLIDKIKNEKGKDCYSFRYFGDNSEGNVLHANTRYVKVIEEAPEGEEYFDDLGEGEMSTIKWKDSEARRLLYKDVEDGNVPDDMNERDVYVMRAEYSAYDFKKFSRRLNAIRNIISDLNTRADEDQAAFLAFVATHEVSVFDRKGHIHWQGSEAQKLAKVDIKDGKFKGKGSYRAMYSLREEYHESFDFDIFSDKIRQEIKTGKYLHTLKVKGKLHKAS
mmetsp:Transcript_7183/g.11360  ORF Transcript_7183/g.11360 Transcript_7183/m.11360 type:complete len:259 (+) Transcript_7183:79-855(+)|eukprot:CAMPEP_0178758748 /NCGR_PEP_ID=MMETSP0744-20121128/14558_1 /TAXON_ID=913974 /ORGANISM="Nitzschia punctata, Strain CCMP561" /LENGTH=258 /DNA_ID=CAMNT_0020413147 /DNA_START=49 /DNA_END=825 /DNA_ORIENTATION=+